MAIYHKTLRYHEDTTEKRSLNDNDIKFLLKLQKEMNTQDTTGTAEPRFWVIKGSEKVRDDENADEIAMYMDNDCVAETTDEVLEYLNTRILPELVDGKKNYKIEAGFSWDFVLIYTGSDGEEECEYMDRGDLQDFLSDNGYQEFTFVGISMRQIVYPNTMFMTEKEAREHLEQNHYHYSADAHTYCMSAWRSPEVWWLWKIIREVKWDELR